MAHSKSTTSVMFAGTASGTLLNPYVVYKSVNMYEQGCDGGRDAVMYNRSKSGWFDSNCFDDWFEKVLIPYCNSVEGRKGKK